MKHLTTIPDDFRSARPITFPCAEARLVPAGKALANDYNPNKVATPEMEALAYSIAICGVTQPIVTYYDEELDRYLVVDGFHRYVILQHGFGLEQIPVVVIEKDVAQRIASTVRHNKAKGEHQVDLMAQLVGRLRAEGADDEQIAKWLQMEFDEVLRLKQVARLA